MTRAKWQLRPSVVLSLVGPAALWLVRPEAPAAPAALLSAIILCPVGRGLVPRRVGGPQGPALRPSALAVAFAACLAFALPAPTLERLVRLTAVIGISIALSRGEPRRAFKLLSVSFLMLLLAAAQTEEIAFALPFLCFLLLLPAALADAEREALERKPGQPSLREARPTLLLAALTLAIFLCLPRFGRGTVARSLLLPMDLTAMGEQLTLDSIVKLKLSSRIAMRVRVDRAIPESQKWRGISFDTFDGTTWSSHAPLGKPVSFGLSLSGDLRAVPRGARILHQEYEVEPGIARHLFAARDAARVGANYIFHPKLHRRGADDLLLLWLPTGTFRYFVDSIPEGAAPESAPDPKLYLELPPSLPQRYGDLAQRIAQGRTDVKGRLEAISSFLRRNGSYALEVTRPDGVPPLDDFLFGTRKGHCELFASAMVVLARLSGIPARLVDGFARGEYSDLTSCYVVRRSDAHAWVEAYQDGRGWTEWDPTPEATPPEGLLARLHAIWERVIALWNGFVADFGAAEQRALLARAVAAVSGIGLRSALVAVLAILALVGSAAAWRARSRWKATLPASSPLAPHMRRAFRLLARLGIARAPSDTPRETLRRASGCASVPSFGKLVELHEEYAYGPPTASREALCSARGLCRELRREVRAEAR